MNNYSFKKLIFSDLYRIRGKSNIGCFLKEIAFGCEYKYIFWMRTCFFLKHIFIFKHILFPFSYFILRHYRFKYGISIPYSTKIGPGFYISHFGGIVVNPKTVIGANCNISQGVNIGQANRGKRKGVAIIGNNVYIAPGAKIIGAVTIGDNVAIGANCVVTSDIPNDAVVVGIPGRIISYEGSICYINRTDYDKPHP